MDILFRLIAMAQIITCQTSKHPDPAGSSMQLAAIERKSTADIVVERIAQVTRHRRLSAGDRLPGGHELVDRLKVSQPVLREALARLQNMGIGSSAAQSHFGRCSLPRR